MGHTFELRIREDRLTEDTQEDRFMAVAIDGPREIHLESADAWIEITLYDNDYGTARTARTEWLSWLSLDPNTGFMTPLLTEDRDHENAYVLIVNRRLSEDYEVRVEGMGVPTMLEFGTHFLRRYDLDILRRGRCLPDPLDRLKPEKSQP